MKIDLQNYQIWVTFSWQTNSGREDRTYPQLHTAPHSGHGQYCFVVLTILLSDSVHCPVLLKLLVLFSSNLSSSNISLLSQGRPPPSGTHTELDEFSKIFQIGLTLVRFTNLTRLTPPPPWHLNWESFIEFLSGTCPIAVTTVINMLHSNRTRREFVYQFIRSSLHPITPDTLVTGLTGPTDFGEMSKKSRKSV